MCVCMLSCSVIFNSFQPLWTATYQTPLSMGLSQKEYWNRLPFSPPGDPPDPGVEPTSPVTPTLAGRFFITEPHGKPQTYVGTSLFK